MAVIHKILGLVLLVGMMVGCGTEWYQYHSTSPNPELVERHQLVSLYISNKFDLAQRRSIEGAVNEWNYALNSSMRLEVKNWSIPSSDEEATYKLAEKNSGIEILLMPSDDSRLTPYKLSSGTIAFSEGVGNSNLIVVLSDRLDNVDLKMVLMHELGHALGAYHVNSRSLMFPYGGNLPFAGEQSVRCIDKITLSQVAGYRHLDMRYLNYCSTKDFP